jgi:hypothetical protein
VIVDVPEARECARSTASVELRPFNCTHSRSYHPELNHIEFFWCQAKRSSRENCNYTFEGLRQTVPPRLDSVRNSTILGNYHSCLHKMELYRAKITYGSTEWKALTSHKRVYNLFLFPIQIRSGPGTPILIE